MTARGVTFLESPRHELYGTLAVFSDFYGNKRDLLQPRPIDAPAKRDCFRDGKA